MKLPILRYNSSPRTLRINSFGGLDLTPNCPAGALSAAENISAELAPLMSVRAPRGRVGHYAAPTGGTSFAGEIVIAAGSTLHFGERAVYTSLESGAQHRFAELSGRLVILPEKLCLYPDGTVLPIEVRFSGAVTVSDGEYAGEPAAANTVTAAEPFPFREGDAVFITGLGEGEMSAIICEMSEDACTLRFYENTFASCAMGAAEVTIERRMPALDFIFENENRLWGCAGDTVYASALGDPFAWNTFDGLSTDSYAVSTGSGGSFTAAAAYKGYPVFFKRDAIYKVYGSAPAKYQLMESCTVGASPSGGRSLAIAGETLIYLSDAGFAAYSGGEPSLFAAELGSVRITDAAAGSDGVKYYVSCMRAGEHCIFVYDTQRGIWMRESGGEGVFFMHNGALLLLEKTGDLIRVSGAPLEGETFEGTPDWYAVFGEVTLDTTERKQVSRITLRISLEEGTEFSAAIACDGGELQTLLHTAARAGAVYTFRITPRRCDRWQLALFGSGGAVLHSVELKLRT